MKSIQTGWSKYYNECIICGHTTFRHKGKGKCLKCYTKIRTHKRINYFRNHNLIKSRIKSRENPSLGLIGEIEVENKLNITKLPNYMKYDYNWKGKKIDVKTSLFHRNSYWKFCLKKQKGLVDYFIIICKDINKSTQYMFLIPDKEINSNNLVISLKTIKKYKKYLWK